VNEWINLLALDKTLSKSSRYFLLHTSHPCTWIVFLCMFLLVYMKNVSSVNLCVDEIHPFFLEKKTKLLLPTCNNC
jgi:hypothetical protein